ncbi:MAG: hypothetical protein ABL866_15235 [Devosia sp.]
MTFLRALVAAALLLAPIPAQAQASIASYDAVRAGLEAVWADLPLTVRNATLTDGAASGYGAYTPATATGYKPGEAIHVYVELLGYGWRENADGTWSVLLDVDLNLKNAAGEIVASQLKFLSADLRSRTRNLETFVAFTATLTDFPAGDYQLDYVVHDRAGGEDTEFALPVTLAGAE